MPAAEFPPKIDIRNTKVIAIYNYMSYSVLNKVYTSQTLVHIWFYIQLLIRSLSFFTLHCNAVHNERIDEGKQVQCTDLCYFSVS